MRFLLIGLFTLVTTSPAFGDARVRFAGAVFDGVTAYSTESLLDAYRSEIGAELDDAVRDRIVRAVVDLYVADGYLAPAAVTVVHPRSGMLVVVVREAHVAHVSVAGREHVNDERFWEEVEVLKSTRPLREGSFREWLRGLRTLGPASVTGSITPAARGRPEHIVSLQVLPSRWSGLAHVDNRAPESLGYELFQGQLAYRFANPRAGSIGVAGAIALDQDRLRFMSMNGSHEIIEASTAFTWNLSRSDSKLPTANDTYSEYDRARTALGIQQPLHRVSTLRVDAFTNVTRYDVEQRDQIGVLVSDDRIRSVDAGVTVSGISSVSRRHDATFKLTRGLDVMGAQLTAPAGRDPVLDYLRTDLNYRFVQNFGASWQLQFAVQAQLTDDELPTSEQFLIGGRQLGGAFDPASVAGDKGVGGRLEGARTVGVSRFLDRLQAYTYYDHGFSESNSANGSSDEASSVGVGLRFGLARFTGSMEVAVPVEKPRSNPIADSGTRLFFTLTQRFP